MRASFSDSRRRGLARATIRHHHRSTSVTACLDPAAAGPCAGASQPRRRAPRGTAVRGRTGSLSGGLAVDRTHVLAPPAARARNARRRCRIQAFQIHHTSIRGIRLCTR